MHGLKPAISAPLMLLLAACGQPAGSDDSAGLTEAPTDARAYDLSDRSALAAFAGLYGASYADCDTGNRYMDEYIEVFDAGFAYRGEMSTLAQIMDEETFRFTNSEGASEMVKFEDDRLVRSPEERSRRTVYLRCP